MAAAAIARLPQDEVAHVPDFWDWIKNWRKSYVDQSLFNYAAEAITLPLIAYQREISGIQQNYVNLQRTGFFRALAIAGAVILFTAAVITGPGVPLATMAANFAGYLIAFAVFTVGFSRFLARRGISARSAAAEALRQLHPEWSDRFDVVDRTFKVRPAVEAEDRPFIAKRVKALRNYANDLGYELK